MNKRSLKTKHIHAVLGELFTFLVGGTFLFASLYYAPALAATGQSRTSPYSSERQQISSLPHFDKIDAEVGEISLQYGAEPSVSIENAYDLDTLYVSEDGYLRLESARKLLYEEFFGRSYRGRDQVLITLPMLTEIRGSGSADFNVGPGFSGKKIDISVSGIASARLEQVEFASMRLDLSGMSDFRADSAMVERLDIDISGRSDVNWVNRAPNLRLRIGSSGVTGFTLQNEDEGSIGEARVIASGKSEVTLRGFAAGGELALNLSGKAKLNYSGEPQIVERRAFGLARIVASEMSFCGLPVF